MLKIEKYRPSKNIDSQKFMRDLEHLFLARSADRAGRVRVSLRRPILSTVNESWFKHAIIILRLDY